MSEDEVNVIEYYLILHDAEKNIFYKCDVTKDNNANDFILSFDSAVTKGIENLNFNIQFNEDNSGNIVDFYNDDKSIVFSYDAFVIRAEEFTEEMQNYFSNYEKEIAREENES